MKKMYINIRDTTNSREQTLASSPIAIILLTTDDCLLRNFQKFYNHGKNNGQTPKNGVVLDTTSNVQPI